jgi:hypothetical protein
MKESSAHIFAVRILATSYERLTIVLGDGGGGVISQVIVALEVSIWSLRMALS